MLKESSASGCFSLFRVPGSRVAVPTAAVAIALLIIRSGITLKPMQRATYSELRICCDSEDTHVSEHVRLEHYEVEHELRVSYRYSGEFPDHECSLIRFDLSFLRADAVILHADMGMYKKGSEPPQGELVSKEWEGATATWHSRPDLLDSYTPRIWDVSDSSRMLYRHDRLDERVV